MDDFVIDGNILVKYTGKDKEVYIPEGIVAIGDKAFFRKGVARVVMPDSVETIGFAGFNNCNQLQEIILSQNLKSIGADAFSGCILKSIALPDGLVDIEPSAFSSCKFDEVSIPNSVERIGAYAFANCRNLVSLRITNNNIDIGEGAFMECTGLAGDCGVIVKDVLYGFTDNEECIIPNGVTKIECGMFRLKYGSKIKSLFVPETVKDINPKCFDALTKLEKCTINIKYRDVKEAQKAIEKIWGVSRLSHLYLDGTLEINDTMEKALLKLMSSKKNRAKLLSIYCHKNTNNRLEKLINIIQPTLEELEGAFFNPYTNEDVKAILLDAQNRLYSSSDVEKYHEDIVNKELGIVEKSLADYRKEFKIVKKNDSYYITGYKGEEHEVIVPAAIKGIPVNIGERAFQYSAYAREVILSEGIEEIGSFAFSNSVLNDVYVPSSVVRCSDWDPFILFGGTIHGPKDSYIEQYAISHKLKFVVD